MNGMRVLMNILWLQTKSSNRWHVRQGCLVDFGESANHDGDKVGCLWKKPDFQKLDFDLPHGATDSPPLRLDCWGINATSYMPEAEQVEGGL